MGIPNVNLNDYTSGMSAIGFSGAACGLGTAAPVVTSLSNLQVFDNVTHVRGRHTLKAGASVTFRSGSSCSADSIQSARSASARTRLRTAPGSLAGVRPRLASTGFAVASFLLGYATHGDPRPTSAESPTRRRGRNGRPTSRTTSARLPADAQPRPALGPLRTLGRGARPSVELRPHDRALRGGLRRRVDRRSPGGTIPADIPKSDFGPRLGFAYDVLGNGRTIVRGGFGVFWNYGPGGTSSSKGQNPPFLRAQALNPRASGPI